MKLTTTEIFNIVVEHIKGSELYEAVPVMYADNHPTNMSGEFVVLNSLTNAVGSIQVATVNVNIYVPDKTPTINGVEQRFPDRDRLDELTRTAFDCLDHFPIDERYFFSISDETLISEGDSIPYTFSNIKLTFKKY